MNCFVFFEADRAENFVCLWLIVRAVPIPLQRFHRIMVGRIWLPTVEFRIIRLRANFGRVRKRRFLLFHTLTKELIRCDQALPTTLGLAQKRMVRVFTVEF
jgi:hypothetical protein